MRRQPRWVPKAAVLAIHERLIAEHGGMAGIRDEGLLESALANPRNRHAYEGGDHFSLAAAYASAISRNHPFHDGNKRVALTVAGVFLALNGHRLRAEESEAAAAATALAGGELDEATFAEWLRRFCVRARSR